MFDDFMHNDFPEMHLNQAHQDAMLHAQNRAMNQAARAQQEAVDDLPKSLHQAYESMPIIRQGNTAMNLKLMLQLLLKQLHSKIDGR